MWHKAISKGHPMGIDLTRVGLLVELANHYTTRGAFLANIVLNNYLTVVAFLSLTFITSGRTEKESAKINIIKYLGYVHGPYEPLSIAPLFGLRMYFGWFNCFDLRAFRASS